jgi:hypothetical protein
MNDLTVSGAKALARGLVERMATLGVPMTLARALEAVAASHDFPDWNRFRDALKKGRVQTSVQGRDVYPPHRLVVTAPGHGSSALIEHEFLLEARQPGVLPIMIRFNDAPFDSYLYQAIVPSAKVTVVDATYTEESTDKIKFRRSLSLDGSGLIVNLWAPSKHLVSAWKALLPLIPSLLERQHLEKPGTLFIQDLGRVDRDNSDDYDVGLPQLMKQLRASGGKRSLIVMTQSDDARQSLYRSPDAWKLIMMAGDYSKLFYRCPFERVVALPFRLPVQSYFSRLFADPNRHLEDAALLIGSMISGHYDYPLDNESEYGSSVLKYLSDNTSWHKKREEAKKAEEEKIKAKFEAKNGAVVVKRDYLNEL